MLVTSHLPTVQKFLIRIRQKKSNLATTPFLRAAIFIRIVHIFYLLELHICLELYIFFIFQYMYIQWTQKVFAHLVILLI